MKFTRPRYLGSALSNMGSKILRRGALKGVWIDVGAHFGETTLSYATQNAGLTVYAFEPNLRVAASLIGQTPNLVVLPMAVAETDGCAQLRINSCEEASSLLPMDENSRRFWKGGNTLREKSVLTVPTIRLDTFMDLMRITCVDFLKVDTQGSDLAVVRSAGGRLQGIRKITMEVDISPHRLYRGSPSKEEVLSFMRGAGFTLVSNEQQSYGQEENLTFQCSSSQ